MSSLHIASWLLNNVRAWEGESLEKLNAQGNLWINCTNLNEFLIPHKTQATQCERHTALMLPSITSAQITGWLLITQTKGGGELGS
jgi:hypothetical protein